MKSFVCLLFVVLSINTAQSGSIVLRGATIFSAPSAKAIESGTVVIENGSIVSVGVDNPQGSETVVDLSGKFLLAGFWNSHVHYLFDNSDILPENLTRLESAISDMFLRWGFVNTIDTGSFPEVLLSIDDAIATGEIAGPKIYKIGGSFVPRNGSPFYIAPIKLPELETAEQAAELAQVALRLGLDGIKLFTGSWGTPDAVVLMDVEHAKAAVTVAHDRGKLAFAHPSDSDGARVAIDAGVDVLAHAFPAEIKGRWDRSLPEKMKQAGMSFIPTLKLFRYDLERMNLPPVIVDRLEKNAVDQLAAINDIGVPVLFGTDVGYMKDANTQREFELMGRAGLDFNDILASLTTAPSALLDLSDHQGRVAKGYQADLVVLNSDPREALSAFSDVAMVVRGGEIIYRQSAE